VGWFAQEYHAHEPCAFMEQGYKSLNLNNQLLRKISAKSVPEEVFLKVQQCWSVRPYEHPLATLQLVGVLETKSKNYYLDYEPGGMSDVRVVFLIRRDENKPVAAFQRSTFHDLWQPLTE